MISWPRSTLFGTPLVPRSTRTNVVGRGTILPTRRPPWASAPASGPSTGAKRICCRDPHGRTGSLHTHLGYRRDPAPRARRRPQADRTRHGAGRVDRRLGRADRDDDARRRGRLSWRSGSSSSAAPSSRSSRASSGATPSPPARRPSRPSPACPGPRVPGTGGRVNWLVACWLLTVLLSLLQVGGMFGGVAQVLNLLVPAISVNVWVGICLALTLALLLGGGYGRIEKLAVIKVSFFTVLTVCAAAVLLATPGAVSASRPRRRLGAPAARPDGLGHRHRSLRHHRRRRHRAGDVSLLVHREGLRALHRPARRLGGVAAAGARLDPRDAPRHRLLAGHLHARHAGLLPARRRRAAPGRPGAQGHRHDRRRCRVSTPTRWAAGRCGSSSPAP